MAANDGAILLTTGKASRSTWEPGNNLDTCANHPVRVPQMRIVEVFVDKLMGSGYIRPKPLKTCGVCELEE